MKDESSSREITSSSREIRLAGSEWTAARTHRPDVEHDAVVFVGAHPRAASIEPLRRALSSIDAVYRGVTDVTTLPRAKHCFFLLDELDHSAFGVFIDAVRSSATVTLIANAIAPHLAAFVERPNVNVIPVCGDPAPISATTLQRAIAMVLAGERVAARGFVQNSLARQPTHGADSHPFVTLLNEASLAANTSTPVVAAVLALQRTGSNFLHDLIGLSVSARVRTFHEHDVPGLADALKHQPALDRRLVQRDARHAARGARLRNAILTAERRYIFVSDRPPEDRLLSYFVKGRSQWLHRSFDAARNRFRNESEIQTRLHEWAWAQVDRQRKWYRNKLLRPFGLNVLETELVRGVFIGRSGPNTLVVVPTAYLRRLAEIATSAFRTDCYKSLAYNSARESGDDAVGRAFREQFALDPEVGTALWAIPEVAHIHGAPVMRTIEATGSFLSAGPRPLRSDSATNTPRPTAEH